LNPYQQYYVKLHHLCLRSYQPKFLVRSACQFCKTELLSLWYDILNFPSNSAYLYVYSQIQQFSYIGCSKRRLNEHSFYRRTSYERAAPLAEKNAAARHHVLISLISLHNEHRVLLHVNTVKHTACLISRRHGSVMSRNSLRSPCVSNSFYVLALPEQHTIW
jgi:hypothetical protein